MDETIYRPQDADWDRTDETIYQPYDCNRAVDTVDGAVSVVRMRAVDTVDSTVLVILIIRLASSLMVDNWDASAPVVLWATLENQRW